MVLPIRVYDTALNLLAEIDNVESCVYAKTFADCKDFQIVLNWNLDYVSAFQKDNFVSFGNDPKKAGIIEETTLLQVNGQGKGGQTLTVVGYEAKNIFLRRLIKPAAGQAFYALGTSASPIPAETIMKTVVSDQCGPTAADANRKFSLLSIVADSARGTQTYLSARYNNLISQLKSLAQAITLGFWIYFDLANKLLKFDVIVGTDHSAGNGVNPEVIFSADYDTAQVISIRKTNSGYANTAFIGGTGTGTGRTIIERALNGAASPSDLARKETFVNANQLSNATDLNYAGDQALWKIRTTTFIDVTPPSFSRFVYGVDYDVGDTVSISVGGQNYSVRVVQAIETQEHLKYELELAFDKISPELPDFLIGQIQAIQASQNNAQ